MTEPVKWVLYWSPRVLSILFAVFISLFALDVFGHGQGFWRTLAALGMHLVPTVLVLLVLLVSWRYEWVGAIVYVALAGVYVVWAAGRFPLGVYFMIAGPLVLAGLLFLLNWIYRRELRPL
jgi:hypothetical protein